MNYKIVFLLLAICFSLQATPSLNVGDKAPPLHIYKWIKEPRVNEYEHGKIYVIEFGATWCKPCIAAIPELSTIATRYRESVQVVSLFVKEPNDGSTKNPIYVEKVKNFVAKKGDQIKYSVAVDSPDKQLETEWLDAAGKQGIPNSFVVNGDGIIAWIGSNPQELKKVIEQIVNNPLEVYAVKPIPGRTNFSTGEDTMYITRLSKFTANQKRTENIGFVTNFQWAAKESAYEKRQGTIIVSGESVRRLYYMAYADTLANYPFYFDPYVRLYPDTIKFPYQRRAYGKYWYRPLLEVKDSSLFEMAFNALPNRFNYYLKVPKEKATALYMRDLMQHDLKRYFGYEVTLETREMPCWNLTVTPKAKEKLLSKKPGKNTMTAESSGATSFKNGEIKDIIFQLELEYGYTPDGWLVHHPDLQPPFFDMTGIQGTIDYVYSKEYVERLTTSFNGGKKFTFEDYKELLHSIGIDLVKSSRKMKVVVIRDPVSNLATGH